MYFQYQSWSKARLVFLSFQAVSESFSASFCCFQPFFIQRPWATSVSDLSTLVGEYGCVLFVCLHPDVIQWRSVGPRPISIGILYASLWTMIQTPTPSKSRKPRPIFATNIKGIVPQFGGRCFDITLDSADSAVQLAQSGFDYGNIRSR